MAGVYVLGCLEETLDTLRHLYRLGAAIDGILSLSEVDARKAQSTNWVDLEPFARSHDLSFDRVANYAMLGERDHDRIGELDLDLLLVVGWQRLVPAEVLGVVRIGSVGFHGSAGVLPWGRGRSPINWSIIEGRNRFLLHMFWLTPEVDDGEVIAIEAYDITADDTVRSVYYKTAMAQATLIHRYLPMMRVGRIEGMKQTGEAFYYPKRTPEDGLIDWNADCRDICRLVRAVTRPYPGAFTSLDGEKLVVWTASDFGDSQLIQRARPGEVVFASRHSQPELVVRAGRGSVLITEYSIDGELPSPGDMLG